MLDRFLRHIEASGLISAGQRILVGYSGGADSTCLLHLMHRAEMDVVAAHLHHSQRREADREQALCQAFATTLEVGFVTGQADVPRLAADRRIGLEEAGREARYAFFNRAARQFECSRIATAHTRGDQVETILLHLARGSGLAGLGGIPAQRGEIVRPLLEFARSETRQYCDQHGLWYHDDPANDDLSFSRARVRHRILPEIRLIHPAADDAIARMALIVSEEDRFLNGAAAAALERAEIRLNGDLRFLTLDLEAAFDAATLCQLPQVLFRRAIRLAVESLGAGLTFEQTAIVQEGVVARTKGSITAEGGLVILEWDEDQIHVRETVSDTFRYPLTVPGETVSEVFGWQFQANSAPERSAPLTRHSLSVDIAASAISGPLHFRSIEPGDRIIPLGFGHRRKLAEILSESKLTSAARRRLPIVCDLIGPIWAPGICIDDRANQDGPVIHIEFGPFTPS